MSGFLFDENLPAELHLPTAKPIVHARSLGSRLTDSEIWTYAQANDLTVVSKDADFSNRILVCSPPPRVVSLRFGNLRRAEMRIFLTHVWPTVELLLRTHKLVSVYSERLEAIAESSLPNG